ncbi:hypothetical protein OESDEN_23232 [Oesophagostomum dentatum]|uniref:Uncharacterized protein n=1 Tax=Oesophagostomum dentatum TaxID=61180 RepID=A0A0B1RVS0_OESDE|nr:hypothetical protein OESDEN_23232 [Oesophagostomum dentatum]
MTTAPQSFTQLRMALYAKLVQYQWTSLLLLLLKQQPARRLLRIIFVMLLERCKEPHLT